MKLTSQYQNFDVKLFERSLKMKEIKFNALERLYLEHREDVKYFLEVDREIYNSTYENDHWGHYFSKDNEKEFEDNYSPLQIINHQIITK